MKERHFVALCIWAVSGLLGILFVSGLFFTVKEGQRAVVFTFGELSSVREPGLRWKWPLVQSVEKVSVRTQREDFEASAVSRNIQTAMTTVTINYSLDPDRLKELYATVGFNVSDKIIYGRVQEIVKGVVAQFTAEELVTKREQVKSLIAEALIAQLKEYHLVATPSGVQITNFSFSPAFNQAVEAKQVAEQQALKAVNDLERVKTEAEQKIAEAQGNAKAIEIQTRAINQQGGKNYVELEAIRKWDGKLPTYLGSGAVPFINLKESGK